MTFLKYTTFVTLMAACMHTAMADVTATMQEDASTPDNSTAVTASANEHATASDDIDDAPISEQEKAATQKEIDRITKIKIKPLRNPNAMLVEMAFKFGKTNATVSTYDEAYQQYCKDARDGDANAQYAIGWMHEYGRGVKKDKATAKLFYSMATEQDHKLASKALPALVDEPEALIPDCMLPDPVVVVEKSTALSHDELLAIEIAKIEQEQAEEHYARSEILFSKQKRIYRIVKRLAETYEVDPHLIMSFIAIESAFNVKATSNKSAQGLMQLIPQTARRFGVINPYRAEDNIRGGIKYIRWLLAYYQGNVRLAAAAYNAGERAVDRYKGVPPYRETQHYVRKLAKLYHKTEHPYDPSLVNKISPILAMQSH